MKLNRHWVGGYFKGGDKLPVEVKMTFPLVEIIWEDAAHCGDGTYNLKEARAYSTACARTVGYLLRKDKKEVVLCMTHFYHDRDMEDSFRLLWMIPRGCIKSIRYLVNP